MRRVSKKVKSPCKKPPSPIAAKMQEASIGAASKAVQLDAGKFARLAVDHPLATRSRQTTVQRRRAKFTKDYHLDRVLANIRLQPATGASATSRLESVRLKVAARGSPVLG